MQPRARRRLVAGLGARGIRRLAGALGLLGAAGGLAGLLHLRLHAQLVADILHAGDGLGPILGHALLLAVFHRAAQIHLTAPNLHIDRARVDVARPRQALTDLIADAVIGLLVAARLLSVESESVSLVYEQDFAPA